MKKIFRTIGIFTLIGLLFLVGANAYMADPSVRGPYYTEEREQMMEKIFENKNYLDWKNLMEQDGRNPRVLTFVNEDNFETFIQMRNARLEQDFEKADQLRAELGMTQSYGRGNYRGNYRGYYKN